MVQPYYVGACRSQTSGTARRRFEYKFEWGRQVTMHRCTDFIYEYYTYKTWLKNTYIQNIILVRSASICDRWFSFHYLLPQGNLHQENPRRRQKSVNPVFLYVGISDSQKIEFRRSVAKLDFRKIPVLTLSPIVRSDRCRFE